MTHDEIDELEGSVETNGVSMYPTDWAAVKSFAKYHGLSVSAAMRVIVRGFFGDSCGYWVTGKGQAEAGR